MHLKVMSVEGPSFDGITDQDGGGSSTVDNQATNYIATNESNQYATNKPNLDLVANSLNPIFSLKNSTGSIVGELRAAKVTLTQSSSSTNTIAELNAPNLTAGQSTFLWIGKDFLQNGNKGYLAYTHQNAPSAQNELALGFNNAGSSLLIRKPFQNTYNQATSSVKVNGGLVCDSAAISNNSQTDAPLSLTNENTNSNTGLRILAPNITTGNKTSITLGRDISNNGNAYTFNSIYSTTESDKRLEINSFGETTPIIKAYKKTTPSTSAITGSVVVPGDLTSSTKVSSEALVLYGSTSGSATLNAPSVISTPYTLTLPNALGTFGQVLTIGAPSGNTAQTSWSTVSTTVTASGVFSRQITNQQTYGSGGVSGLVVFDAPDSVNTTGTVPITLESNNYTFKNTAGYATAFNVSYTVVWASNANGTAGTIKQAWISKNLNFNDRYGFTTINHVVNQSQTQETTATIVLQPNETFGIRVYQATGADQKINNASTDMTKIQITQVQGTVPPEVGIQTLALTTPSSLFTISGSPASGSNPTISFTTTTTPTGSGSSIVLANSPTITGATLSGTTNITGTAILQGQSTIANAIVTKFVEQASVIDTTTDSGVLNLTSQSETSWIFKSIGSSYSVKLPSEPTITIGSKYKFVNQTALDISIRNANNTLLYVLKAKATVECLLISNAETVISWKFIPVLYDTITCTPEEFKIGKGGFVFENTATKLVLGNVSDNTIRIYPHSSQTSNYDFILPTNMGISGQVLTSQGSGNPLAWSESLNNLSVLNITSTGNTISNNSGNVLTVSGQVRPFTVENTASTGAKITSTNLAPNLVSDGNGANSVVMIQGRELSEYQSIISKFVYISPNSWQNHWSLGLYLKDPTIEVREANLPFQQAKQSFTVYGGIESTFLKTQNFQITNAANTIYNTTGSTTPNLTLITQANSNTPLKIENNSPLTNSIAEFQVQNLSAANSSFLWFGKNFTTGNMGYLAYTFENTPSAQNELALGFNNTGSSLIIRKPFQNADNDATSSVRVNGGIVCDSFRSTGSISGTIQTSNITTTSDIKFDKGNGQIRSLTFDYGSATPTFDWAYDTVNPTVNFSYPATQTPSRPSNRQYQWQQVGKQYSFSLQIFIQIDSCSGDIKVPFINNCNPPTPACGEYTQNDLSGLTVPGFPEVYLPMGVYIPAL